MYNLKISPMVAQDMKEIKYYISEELCNPTAANDLMKLMTSKIRNLIDFPYSGTLLRSIVNVNTAYRFLVCKNYLIFYRVEVKNIFVVRVLYNRRDYMKILFENNLDYEE